MSDSLRSYTSRYTFNPSVARTIIDLVEEDCDNGSLTTSELSRHDRLTEHPYGRLLMTVLELQYRGVLALHPLGNSAGGPKGSPEYLVLGLTDRADGLLRSERYSVHPDGALKQS